MMNADRLIARMANRQHGVFSHRQAVAVGFTRRQIGRRRSSGAWISLTHGVYALDSAPATWHRQVMAAVLSKNRARASGMTAGALHEIANCRKGKPEIAVPSTGNADSRIATVRRRSSFSNLGLVLIDHIPTTDIPNTLFDLATHLSPAHLRRAIDDCLVRGKVTAEDLHSMLERHDGCRLAGTVAFREAIADITDAYIPTESDLELLLVTVLDDPRVPELSLQARLPWWRELPHRIDAFIRPWSLIIEGDGRPFHTKRADFENDRKRDNLAVANGYRVLRFTYRMLDGDPAGVLQTVLRAGNAETRPNAAPRYGTG
jgi:very-short-patch-repair endonuclease